MKSYNPCSIVDLEVYTDKMKFDKLFIVITGCILGFKGVGHLYSEMVHTLNRNGNDA